MPERTPSMTVGALREALDGLDDELEVYMDGVSLSPLGPVLRLDVAPVRDQEGCPWSEESKPPEERSLRWIETHIAYPRPESPDREVLVLDSADPEGEPWWAE